MTNRLSDSQLANIAKQKFQTEQINKIPGIQIDLPSKGLVYPEHSVLRQGVLDIRYMTAYDEDILTNRSYIQKGILFEKLLESIITTPGVNVKDLIDADIDWTVFMIRVMSYDPIYKVKVTTPDNQTIDSEINLNKLKFKEFNLVPDENGEFDYRTTDGYNLKFRYASTATQKNIPPESLVSHFLKNTIMQVDDTRDINKINEWIRYKFLRKESSLFREYINLNAPEVDLSYDFEYTTKEGNKETFRAGFQIGSDFIWL